MLAGGTSETQPVGLTNGAGGTGRTGVLRLTTATFPKALGPYRRTPLRSGSMKSSGQTTGPPTPVCRASIQPAATGRSTPRVRCQRSMAQSKLRSATATCRHVSGLFTLGIGAWTGTLATSSLGVLRSDCPMPGLPHPPHDLHRAAGALGEVGARGVQVRRVSLPAPARVTVL